MQRETTRINWLLRQLKETKLKVRIDSWGVRSRESLSEMLETVRNNQALIIPSDNRDISKFTITLTRSMGLKQRGGTKSSFIDSVISAIDDFYGDVVQSLKEWQPTAPRISKSQKDNVPSTHDDLDLKNNHEIVKLETESIKNVSTDVTSSEHTKEITEIDPGN